MSPPQKILKILKILLPKINDVRKNYFKPSTFIVKGHKIEARYYTVQDWTNVNPAIWKTLWQKFSWFAWKNLKNLVQGVIVGPTTMVVGPIQPHLMRVPPGQT